MTKELFADSASDIGVVAGAVRIDLVSMSATEKDAGGQPVMEFRQRVVMPVEGFLRTFAMMQDLMTKLETAGVVRKAHGSGGAPVEPSSPNF